MEFFFVVQRNFFETDESVDVFFAMWQVKDLIESFEA